MRVCVQEEEVRRAEEEKQRAEDEEASKWMNMISVEDTVRMCVCWCVSVVCGGGGGRYVAAMALYFFLRGPGVRHAT